MEAQMVLLERQATVASGAKLAEAFTFSAQVTAHLNSKFPDHELKSWLQIGGVFATIYWTVEFPDMSDFEAVMGATLMDQEYLSIVAQASDCFLPGSVKDTLLRSL
jgi:hypothetical protein